MFCKYCGKEIDNDAKFCPFCGQVQQKQMTNGTSQPLYSETEERNPYSYGTGENTSQKSDMYSKTTAPSTQELPMKWYYFVIWFQLFAAALVSVFNAFQYFTGSHYGEEKAALVYYYYGNGLKVVDILMAVCSVIAVVWALYARKQLRNYKRQAPRIYITYLTFNLLTTILYVALVFLITKELLLGTRIVASLVTTIVMIALNKIYFQKRTALFVQ